MQSVDRTIRRSANRTNKWRARGGGDSKAALQRHARAVCSHVCAVQTAAVHLVSVVDRRSSLVIVVVFVVFEGRADVWRAPSTSTLPSPRPPSRRPHHSAIRDAARVARCSSSFGSLSDWSIFSHFRARALILRRRFTRRSSDDVKGRRRRARALTHVAAGRSSDRRG